MGNCCGSASAACTVAQCSSDFSLPPPPPHRRWSDSTSSSTEKEKATLKKRGRLASTSLTVSAVLALREDGDVGSSSFHSTVGDAAASAARRTHSNVAALAAPMHTPAVPVTAKPQHGANGSGPGLPMADLFHISASSLSALLTNGDINDNAEDGVCTFGDGEGQSSVVEVSPPTQSVKGDAHTCSEMDMASEWDPPSFERLGRRPERRGRCGLDRIRLRHLIISESEARASLAAIYTHERQRLLLQFAQEWFIAVHISMWRGYESKWAAQCICWIMAVERVTREEVERMWLTERATLMHRAKPFWAPPLSARELTMLDTAASYGVKREKSLPPVSNSVTAADLTSSEEAADDDTSNMCSPSIRAFSTLALSTLSELPHKQQLSALSGSRLATDGKSKVPRSASRGSARRALSSVSSPASPLYSPLQLKRLTPAQQALHDKLAQGRCIAATGAHT
ncbi:hypothetical protein GH5_08480 [Leishmania sp. Ghana 2012 LV757]|uniref:hypothetical protein n=1 Tax=Leishmania sp. Ghana 2012 LV757 TaxID=2803181 RepID=UPI001B632211|nr:hypothetical protein GH5_08480 [Leishmania sp. Ghana 2012 LV757]